MDYKISKTYEVETDTYEYAYEVKAKTPNFELSEDEITLKSTPVTRAATTDVDLTGAFLNDGTGTVSWAAVDGLTIAPTTFTISGGAASETFTITYNKDVATSGSVDVTFSDGTTNKVLTVNYSSVVAHEWATVSATTTWDWTTFGYEKNSSVQLSSSTTPQKNEEFNFGDMDGEVLEFDAKIPDGFNAEALLMTAEYPIRDQNNSEFWQGQSIRIKTSEPGTLYIKYSNTGNNNNERNLTVNGTIFGEGTSNATFIEAEDIPVPAGEISIIAMEGKDKSNLRIQKIIFTKSAAEQETVAITCEGGLASYVNYTKDLDFTGSTAKAYIVTATSASSVTMTEVAKVPAGTGVIIMGGAKGDNINVLTTTSAPAVEDNLLEATTESTGTTVSTGEAYGLSKTDGKFHKLNAGTIPAGKAYLPASAMSAEILDLDFDGSSDITTGIENVETAQKSFLDGEFYNLNGQRVAQPTRGLYIVNGKKVVIK